MNNFDYHIAADENGDIFIYTEKPVRKIESNNRYWTTTHSNGLKIKDHKSGIIYFGKFFPITDEMLNMTWSDDAIRIKINIEKDLG